MTPLERIMATIHSKKVDRIPVVVPYIQYYLSYIIDKISSFSWADLSHGSIEKQKQIVIKTYNFFGYDWVRV